MVKVDFKNNQSIKSMCKELEVKHYVVGKGDYINKEDLNAMLHLAGLALQHCINDIRRASKQYVETTDEYDRSNLQANIESNLNMYEKYYAIYKKVAGRE